MYSNGFRKKLSSQNPFYSNSKKTSVRSVPRCNSRLDIKHNLILDPNFITGFTDGEGCFTLSITKSNQVKSS